MRFGVVGHPVAHSLSPAIFGAAFSAAGLADHTYEHLDAPDARAFDAVVEGLRAGRLAGVNVTAPHKGRALEAADQASPEARVVGAANVLVDQGGVLVAHNTDVGALVEEIRALGEAPRVALVLGAGGAARASVVALERVGATRVFVAARGTHHAAEALVPLGARAVPWGAEPPELVDLVVHATPLGMQGVDRGDEAVRAVPFGRLARAACVLDLIYRPRTTPLLEAARARGLPAAGGRGMFVRQAEASFRLFVGADPPPGVMGAVVDEALARGPAPSSRST